MDLTVSLGRLSLSNPILVASGTFGYAREMDGVLDFGRLGGIVPKTVTASPRKGNTPPRTHETAAGMLNSIGLDNDGIDHFIEHHLPYLTSLPTPILANIAGKNEREFTEMASLLSEQKGLAGIELNLSCPNVSGGVDFATDPVVTRRVVENVRKVTAQPILAKLTPNVTNVVPIAAAAAEGGADAITIANTYVGMAIDWKRRRPILGNRIGGLSGPAIKPITLRIVWQVAQQVDIPIVGVGGIATLDDVMEFVVAGASAVQLGTVNFYNPTAAIAILDALPDAVRSLGAQSLQEVVGTICT